MQTLIKNELDNNLPIINIMKKRFKKSLKCGKPLFAEYLLFFRFFQNIIDQIILKIKVHKLNIIERNQKQQIYFADKNNNVYLVCNLTITQYKIFSDISNLSDEVIYTNYFEQFLKSNLFVISTEQKQFLTNINKNKDIRWQDRTQNLNLITSRYTPDTVTISGSNIVNYIYNSPLGSVLSYITPDYTGLVFNYSGVDSDITFSNIPINTVFNLLVVGGGGGPSYSTCAGGGGGISYIENYNLISDVTLKFFIGKGGTMGSDKYGISGENSFFDIYQSNGGGGPLNGSISGGIGGSVNNIFGGGGGGGGGVSDINSIGGTNSEGGNSGQNSNIYYGGDSYFNTPGNPTINVPFYGTALTQLFLGGGGSATSPLGRGSGGCGSGGLISIKKCNTNGSYVANSFGGGASFLNAANPDIVSIGVGGNGVVMIWWNNVTSDDGVSNGNGNGKLPPPPVDVKQPTNT